MLNLVGNVFSLATAGSPLWSGPHTSESTYNYVASTGSANAYVVTLAPAITTYTTGAHYFFKANFANTGSATVNINGQGAKTIKKYTSVGGANLAADDIRSGALVEVVYDGTDMQIISLLGNAGGTPGGSNTQVQFNSSGAFAGDSGFLWDNTNKLLYVARNNTTGMGGIVQTSNSASLSVNAGSRFEACHDNSPGYNCLRMEIAYANLSDGSGNQQWSRLYSYWSALAEAYPLIARKHNDTVVHIGGAANATVGYAAFTSSGASRFANAAVVGRGLVSIEGAPTELTGQTGDLGSQTLLASSHTAGMYRICGFVAVTSAGSGSTVAWTLSWRSPASGSDLTHNIFWSSGAAETDTFSVASANEFNVCKVIRSTGASAISLNPGDMNTAVYTQAWTVERLR
jgi:hypothetical protein